MRCCFRLNLCLQVLRAGTVSCADVGSVLFVDELSIFRMPCPGRGGSKSCGLCCAGSLGVWVSRWGEVCGWVGGWGVFCGFCFLMLW